VSQFNKTSTRTAVKSPIQSDGTAANHDGRIGVTRDAKSELFLLAVALLDVGKSTFYEKADTRVDRLRTLTREVAITDPVWLAGFLGWQRAEGNMRTTPLVGALEAAKAMVEAKVPGARQIVASVLQRADEPGEALAYWTSHYGRTIPMPVKRGVADAVRKLYNEYALLRYDTASKGYRFGDVIELVHPTAGVPWQNDLFRHALDRRHGRENGVPESLTMVRANAALREQFTAMPAVLLDAGNLRAAGMTWEDVLSLAGDRLAKRDVWEALIPSMGYMAILRNLRGFDDAGVSDTVASQVAARLADPDQVAKSKQFPFRFYAAHKAVGSFRWAQALEKALAASLANVPALPGRTLVMVDQSPSMFPGYHFSTQAQNEHIGNADLAKLFGSAVALRANDATLAGYGQTSYRVEFRKGDALLKVMDRFTMVNGTDTFGAIGNHFDRHDRVIVVTDEQNNSGRYSSVDQVVPREVPVYTWNIGGYRVGSTTSGLGTRHTFAGLTDVAFRLVSLLESGRDGAWPWL
jgi:TROVE domain-containing protein